MPDLFQSLQNHDLAFLRIVAGLWGIELEAREPDKAISELSASLLDRELAGEILAALTPQAQSALAALAASNGRVPWASFTRQFGSVRDMGAAKRDREKPYLDPASARRSCSTGRCCSRHSSAPSRARRNLPTSRTTCSRS